MITQNEISSLNLSPTKKDFVQIWNELIEVASKITERWDPTSTNESDPGIVLLKALAGIADKLNYNIDKNILEAFMPTAAQMESMQKLCELVGYNIKYYQSATTTARISYTGDTSEGSDERIKDFLPIPKFTTLTNADKDVTFVTTNTIPVYITNSTPYVEVPCIEGQISQCESSNENNLITLAQLDDNYRYYLPETQIAENGIFVYNATTSILSDDSATLTDDNTAWLQVDNLNVQAPGIRVFKFGYDSFEGRPYIAFPEDVGSLIEDGLFIYFVRTSGLSGNISARTLEVLEIPTGDAWKDFSAEQFEVVNVSAATNGSNIENISTAYNNFKKTVGTFDTLVTCRDYMNKIYSLMDANNTPYVSNILVTDIRNDINSANTLCSFNEFGILYKELPLLDDDSKALIDHFDLVLYPFKTFTQVSSATTDLSTPYNDSFTYIEDPTKREIEAALTDFKTCAHNFESPNDGDLVAINNYLRLDALIATSLRVSEAEAKDILKNIKVALVNEFNLRKLDFGEEIPFDSILSVIENADTRIKIVSLQEPTLLTTYSVKERVTEGNTSIVTSKEYGIASQADIDADIQGATNKKTVYDVIYKEEDGTYCTTAKEIYNKLVLRNILAGRASLFDYDETFISNNDEKPYTITKDITDALDDTKVLLKDPVLNKSPLTDEQINDLTPDKLKELTEDFDVTAESLNAAVTLKTNAISSPGEFILFDSNGPIKQGFYSDTSVLTLKVTSLRTAEGDSKTVVWRLYETYEYDFNPEEPATYSRTFAAGRASSAVTNSKGVINNVSKVEALCEITSNTDTFNNITLGKNEVIKFRAPNLITTQTFPAYVYYNYTKAPTSSGEVPSGIDSTNGSPAEVTSLIDFINSFPPKDFFTTFWKKDYIVGKLSTLTAARNASGAQIDQSNQVPSIFEAAIAMGTSIDVSGKGTLNLVFTDEAKFYEFLSCYSIDEANAGKTDAEKTEIKANQIRDFLKVYLGTDSVDDSYVNTLVSKTEIEFKYYPLNNGTIANWSKYIRECYSLKNSGVTLPGITTLWRRSSSTRHIPGRLVTSEGYRLYAQSGEYLAGQDVGNITYICTYLGEDPKFYNIAENGDVQLGVGDKLYIHYTPSSTNEDGENTTAEPISVVYEGKADGEPIILRPKGFTLMPSADVAGSQISSWKKTGVKFGSVGSEEVNLLALGANEQIEMRSISRVTLKTPARFYKNFDNVDLENGSITEYELKDGEYIFYTDLNTQEAAYYGSGSVVTLRGGAHIPKNSATKEISEILSQGLQVIPWSGMVALNEDKTVTITEYQYVTLTEGDTINRIILDKDNELKIDNSWKKCSSASYLRAGSESPERLPTLELDPSISPGWEVCSRLELATAPGLAQTLKTQKIVTVVPNATQVFNPNIGSSGSNTIRASVTSITNKLKVYQSTDAEALEDYIEIAPQLTENPASGYTGEYLKDAFGNVLVDSDNVSTAQALTQTLYEPVSIKLDTLVRSASGTFTPATDKNKPSAVAATAQMRVFRETLPELVELSDANEVITPISVKNGVSLDYSAEKEYNSEVINSYWTKLDPSIALFTEKSGVGTIKSPQALNLHFMIPEASTGSASDLFGIFSIYFDTSAPLNSTTEIPNEGYRVFIDIPSELGNYNEVISIFNNRDNDGKDAWWPEGTGGEAYPNRLYLRAGLNCIKVLKSCNLLIKAETSVTGNILYDNLRLVKGRVTNGINLALLDPDAMGASQLQSQTAEQKTALANKILTSIAAIDTNHEFYYNVPIENSLAMEFDDNINSLSNPYTLYDINNINNNFVVSKLDINYLDTGLRIAKSSRSSSY